MVDLLASYGPAARQAVPELLAIIQARTSGRRFSEELADAAIRALARIDPELGVSLLVDQLKQSPLRFFTCKVLAEQGEAAKAATTELRGN